MNEMPTRWEIAADDTSEGRWPSPVPDVAIAEQQRHLGITATADRPPELQQ